STCDLAKVTISQVRADAIQSTVTDELSVVPHVEEFRAELDIASPLLADCEVLEERETPVVSARPTNRVARGIAECVGCWCRVDRGIEPLADSVGIMSTTADIRTVGDIRNNAGYATSARTNI